MIEFDDPDACITLQAVQSCDIIQYDDYSDLFAKISRQGSVVISLLRSNFFSIHPAYQLGILSRVVCFSTVKKFIKELIPPYMYDDYSILFPETSEIMVLNQVERDSIELKKVLNNVALLPSGVVHVLSSNSFVGKLIILYVIISIMTRGWYNLMSIFRLCDDFYEFRS